MVYFANISVGGTILAKNILRETCLQVIKYLAQSGEATQYEIKKETALSYASIHEAIKDLIWANLVIETRQAEGPGPSQKRFFRLTFEGLIRYFALVSFEEWRRKTDKTHVQVNKDVRRIIEKYHDYLTIFSEWRYIEKMVDPDVPDITYVFLYAATLDCVSFLGPPEESPERRHEGYPIPPFLEKDLKHWKEESEKRWKRIFVIRFLIQLLTWLREDAPEDILRGTPNETLFSFMRDFFETQKARKIGALKRLEAAERDLLGQFGAKEEKKPLLRVLDKASGSANHQ